MRKIVLIALSLLILHVDVFSQVIEGVVTDTATDEGLVYVNIGVVGKDVGTVSNQEGRFRLMVDKQYDQDTLKLSMVGYQPRSFVVADFRKQLQRDPTVPLTEAITTLKEVVVENRRYRGRKLKERIIGNTKAVVTNQTYFAFNALGHST